MNLEQKQNLNEKINKLEGLLAYAVQHDEVVEAAHDDEMLEVADAD